VIYASTERNEKKNWVSRLYSKPSLDSSGGVTCLWEDDNMDAQPFMGLDTHDQNIGYLVFTSNRYDREKADICMAEIKEDGVNKPAVTLLSQDKNFNFFPTYGDSNKHIYYLSVQSGVIGADLEVSKVRMAGSSPGRLRFRSLQNDQIYNSDADDRIYIVTLENGKKQISSVTTDGQQRRNLPYPAEFKKADCSQPSVSKDGKRILFVSNRVTSANMRPNNDIYVINEDGTNWQQLTNNESDDSHPMWSPNEEGVVYFLSTRGGATNIWRCKIVAGQ
jgi:Tol biopolymer transport system component